MQQYRMITLPWQRTASVLPRLTAPALPARQPLAHKKHCRQQKLPEQLHQWRLCSANVASGGAGILESQPEVASSASAAPQQFNWDKQWYPLAQIDDLDPATPGHFRLLGRDLVIWFDVAENSWRAFADRCPHRLAPLSEGRIDQEGRIYCNYHGWAFAGDGSCVSVPQLDPEKKLVPSRSCVAAYPTRVAEGLLWVWADSGAAAEAESAAPGAWRGLAPEIDEHGDDAYSPMMRGHKWYVRDLPVAWLAAKENAYNDCSHDTVLHSGVVPGLHRSNAQPMQMRVEEMTSTGYVVREQRGILTDTSSFPCGARRDSAGHVGVVYVIPTGVGTCRQMHTYFDVKFSRQSPAAAAAPSATQMPEHQLMQPRHQREQQPAAAPSTLAKAWQLLQRRFFMLWLKLQAAMTPGWMHHHLSHTVVDADIAMQSRVDANRALDERVYMPAAVDAGPAAFMQWLREHGSDGPPVCKLGDPFPGLPAGAAPPPQRDRAALLDRFNSHTVHCRMCRTAHARLSAAERVAGMLALLAGAAALAAAALLATGWLAGVGIAAAAPAAAAVAGLAVFAGAAAALRSLLARWVAQFVFVDYDHHHVSKRD